MSWELMLAIEVFLAPLCWSIRDHAMGNSGSRKATNKERNIGCCQASHSMLPLIVFNLFKVSRRGTNNKPRHEPQDCLSLSLYDNAVLTYLLSDTF